MRSTYSAYKNWKEKFCHYMAASKANLWFPTFPPVYHLLSGFRQVATDHAWKHASTWSELGCHQNVLDWLLNEVLLKVQTMRLFLISGFQWRIHKIFIILGTINILSLVSRVSQRSRKFGYRYQVLALKSLQITLELLESRGQTVR